MAAVSKRPPGVRHYNSLEDVPLDIEKYWQQRHDIFSKYDEGVWLTDEGWFGVTPEPIAKKIAEHVATADASKTVLIDAFAGSGGNVIQFALSGRWKQIFAIEKDEKTLQCARHNAEIYGVNRKIFWIHGDIFDEMERRFKSLAKNAVIFASPPWGGPNYTDYPVFNLSYMLPYPLSHLYKSFHKYFSNIVLYLPRTSDLEQIARYADKGQKTMVIHYCMHGASKALCVYYGGFRLNDPQYQLTNEGHKV